jgi:hypothetical protein
MGGWPRLLISLATPTQSVLVLRGLCEGRESRAVPDGTRFRLTLFSPHLRAGLVNAVASRLERNVKDGAPGATRSRAPSVRRLVPGCRTLGGRGDACGVVRVARLPP